MTFVGNQINHRLWITCGQQGITFLKVGNLSGLMCRIPVLNQDGLEDLI